MRKLLIVLIIISWGGSCFAGTTGFQEYIIPGPEEILRSHYVYIDNNPSIGNTLHSVVSITASTDGTVINYDHWENGYGSADETITLNANEFYYFESSNVPANPRGTAIYYDGGDRLSIIGGPVFVARASWPESPGTVLALAWELYPLQALEETFEMPVGSELFPSPDPGSDNGPPFSDFEAVILMVQSCADNNTITITNASGTQVWSGIVNKGRNVTDPTAAAYLRQVEKGATVSGTAPIQTQFITGDRDIFSIRSEVRGYTGVPFPVWNTKYSAPITSFAPAQAGDTDSRTDIYLYNPNDNAIDVTYQDSTTGSFRIDAKELVSFREETGHYVPRQSGVNFEGTEKFWGFGSVGTGWDTWDWGFDLVPQQLFRTEYIIGWAPGDLGNNNNYSAVFVMPQNPNTTIFVDYDQDNVTDDSYTISFPQVQRIVDASDNNMTGSRIFATDTISVIYGEISGESTAEASPGLDLGYTILPISDIWMDQVMSIEKQSFPDTVLINQETEFTLQVQAFSYTVWSLSVTDELPAGWQYVAHSTNITFSNGNPPVQVEPTITGDLLNGLDLFWNLGYTIDPSESISITFRAYPTVTAALGINQNRTEAEGESGGNTFNPDDTDFIFVIDGGSIGDYIWNDLNADGVQDPGETGISGVKIALLDVSDDTVDIVYTDMNGLYQFTAIPPGDYSVHVDESTLPAGFFSTTFNDPLSVTLLSGETIDDADFGYCDNIGIDIEKSTNGQDADTPQGPVLTVGVPVTWEYRVVNTGVVPLANISVVDNDPGVTPVFIGGDDSPANNLLDPGETWVYQASDTAVAGQYQNLGTVNADYNGQPFSDNDPSHYFGSAPRIRIKKLINGLDVDAPPGPTVIVDDSLEWCFTVTNTGNVPLWNIAIADSDVSIVPVYQSGDLNSNDTLDVAEIWTYCVYDSARAGQIINIASVTGTADSVRTVADEDTSYYYGADSFDFGDAPAPYPTLAMNSGAVHAIVPGIFLGYSVDGDPDGQPSVDAQGDDIDGNNDDEGVQFTTLITGQDADLAVTASTSGYLNAWIDFNNDGDWQDPGEQVAVNQLLSAGSNQVVFPMPTAVASPSLFARFRFSSERDLSFNGYAPDGEVEDYLMPVEGIVPVELSAFTAAFEGTGVHLEWTTQSETENLGFHIYRSTEKTGLYNQITRKMIPGANNSSVMHQYSYLDHTVESGNTYYYKLVDINNEGGRTFHGPLEVIIDVPMHYDLAQNYPNPFNPATTIPFRIKESGFVQLVILNLNGQIVRELVAQHINAGFYEVVWDGTNEYGLPVTSGTYFYRMQVNGYQKIRKMVFMK